MTDEQPRWVDELRRYLDRKDFPNNSELQLIVEVHDGVLYKVRLEAIDMRGRCLEIPSRAS